MAYLESPPIDARTDAMNRGTPKDRRRLSPRHARIRQRRRADHGRARREAVRLHGDIASARSRSSRPRSSSASQRRSATLAVIRSAGAFGVSILGAEHAALADRFAGRTGLKGCSALPRRRLADARDRRAAVDRCARRDGLHGRGSPRSPHSRDRDRPRRRGPPPRRRAGAAPLARTIPAARLSQGDGVSDSLDAMDRPPAAATPTAERREPVARLDARAGGDRSHRRRSDPHAPDGHRRPRGAARRQARAPQRARDAELSPTLAGRMNRYARWALVDGLGPGVTVCLLMPNRPEYLAIWLGVTQVGGIVALLNTNLAGQPLAHCIRIASARHIIVAAELAGAYAIRGPASRRPAEALAARGGVLGRPRDSTSRSTITTAVHWPWRNAAMSAIADRALMIYTSGTTGLPKAAHVSHHRIMMWSHWFAGLADIRSDDRMYDCLPMYHSVGGIVGDRRGAGQWRLGGRAGAIFRAPVLGRRRRWDCTLFQYIGELCRYLVAAPPHPAERAHQSAPRLRQRHERPTCGRGSRSASPSPRILEFYAATEGTFSLYNVEGKVGAIGTVPSFLAAPQSDRARAFRPRRQASRCAAPTASASAARRASRARRSAASIATAAICRRASKATPTRRQREEDPARRFRARRRLYAQRRSHAHRRARLLLFRRPRSATRSAGRARMSRRPKSRRDLERRARRQRGRRSMASTVPGAEGRAGMALIVAKARSTSRRSRAHLRAPARLRAPCLPARRARARGHRDVQA